MDEMETIKSRIKKLHSLISHEATPEFEKKAALDRLKAICALYNVDLADVLSSHEEWVEFSWKTPHDKRILFAVYRKLKDVGDFEYMRKGKKVWLLLSKAQAADAKVLYDHYRKAFASELEDFVSAFISKHRLFSESNVEYVCQDQMTVDLSQWFARRNAMKEGMKTLPDPLIKQITAKGESDA